MIDKFGEQAQSNVLSLTFNGAPTISISANTPSTDVGQYIMITNNTSGGTKPYTFVYNAQSGLIVAGNTVTASVAGTYTLTENVIDKFGEQAQSNVLSLTFNGAPTISISANTPSTDVGQYIMITNNTSGGTKPYTFVYNAQSGLIVAGNTVTASVAGTYTLTENVIDKFGEQAQSNVLSLTFNGAPTISISANTPSTDVGQYIMITNNTSGGTKPYTFVYNAQSGLIVAGNTVTASVAGTYTLTENVIDKFGEQAQSNVLSLTFNGAPTISISANTPSTDVGQYIMITNNTSGGTKPYTFVYNAQSGLIVAGNTVTASVAGTYTLTENVIDKFGEQAQSNVLSLTFNGAPTISISANTPSTDVGQYIMITNNTSGGTKPYTFVYNAQSGLIVAGNTVTASVAGTYTLTENVIDKFGEQAQSNVLSLTFNGAPTISISANTPSTDVGQYIMITNNTSGGTKPYTFVYNAQSGLIVAGNTVTASVAGTYTLTENVIDKFGEQAQSNVLSLTFNGAPTISISANTPSTDVGQYIMITNNTSGGTKPYTFVYNAQSGLIVAGNTVTASVAGTYTLTENVIDKFGEQAQSNVLSLTFNGAPTISISANTPSTDVGQYIMITNNTSGGTKPYTFVYNAQSGLIVAGNTVTASVAGTYTLTENVIDKFGNRRSPTYYP